jgi:hypothetical protein
LPFGKKLQPLAIRLSVMRRTPHSAADKRSACGATGAHSSPVKASISFRRLAHQRPPTRLAGKSCLFSRWKVARSSRPIISAMAEQPQTKSGVVSLAAVISHSAFDVESGTKYF